MTADSPQNGPSRLQSAPLCVSFLRPCDRLNAFISVKRGRTIHPLLGERAGVRASVFSLRAAHGKARHHFEREFPNPRSGVPVLNRIPLGRSR